MFKVIFFVVLFVVAVNCQRTSIFYCHDTKSIDAIDVNRFTGTWFEIKKYTANFDRDGICIKHIFSGDETNFKMQISKRQEVSQVIYTLNGNGKIPNNAKGSLSIVFDDAFLGAAMDIKVLGTDYNDYAVLYSCTNSIFWHDERLWILSRKAALPVDKIEVVRDILIANGLNEGDLYPTNQFNCPNN